MLHTITQKTFLTVKFYFFCKQFHFTVLYKFGSLG